MKDTDARRTLHVRRIIESVMIAATANPVTSPRKTPVRRDFA